MIIDKIKKAILSSRIKNVTVSSHTLTTVGLDAYHDMIKIYIELLKKVAEESAYLISKHSDAIADAIVTLQPLYKDIENNETLKSIVPQFIESIEHITDKYSKPINSLVEQIEQAAKGKD